MSLIARLLIGDNNVGFYSEEYLIDACAFQFLNHTNYLYPNSEANYGTVCLTLRKPENLYLYSWYIEQSKISGRIEFELSKYGDTPKKALDFEGAQCFSLSEEYDKSDKSQVQLKLEFVAEEITLGGIKFNYNNK
ncbi:MAG: type VI secretion system tube protein TssD [Tannerellaceae bacterium]